MIWKIVFDFLFAIAVIGWGVRQYVQENRIKNLEKQVSVLTSFVNALSVNLSSHLGFDDAVVIGDNLDFFDIEFDIEEDDE